MAAPVSLLSGADDALGTESYQLIQARCRNGVGMVLTSRGNTFHEVIMTIVVGVVVSQPV